MSYELYQQGPGVWIPLAILSIVLTAFAYGIIPMVMAWTRSEPITRKRFRRRCFLWNILAMAGFAALNGSVNGAPYLLWTSIFAAWGSKILRNKGLLEDEDGPVKYGPDSVTRCKSCGYTSKEYFEACPKCGKFAKEYVNAAETAVPANPVPAQVPPTPEKRPIFCTECGEPSVPGSRFCRKCGARLYPGA